MKLTFKAHASNKNSTQTIVRTRNFQLVLDEPEDLGGTDQGPNPVEYVLAALAGCLNVVGHVVAKEMNMPLNGLEFELEGDLDPAKFMGKATNERAGYQEVRVKVKPDTTADVATLQKWLSTIEKRCPVSDNIAHVTPVKITLA